MTSTAVARCPVCGGCLATDGGTVSVLSDGPAGVEVAHRTCCLSCGRSFEVSTLCRPVRTEVRLGSAVVASETVSCETVSERRGE